MTRRKPLIGKKLKYHRKKHPAAVVNRREDVRKRRAEAKITKINLKSLLKTVSPSKAPPVAKIWSPATEIEAAASKSHSSLLNARPLSVKETTNIDSASIISTPSLVEANTRNLPSCVAREIYIQPLPPAALPIVFPQTFVQPAVTCASTTAAYPNHSRDNGSSAFQESSHNYWLEYLPSTSLIEYDQSITFY